MGRHMHDEASAVYRVKVTRRYSPTEWRPEGAETVSYMGPYTTLGAARNLAARLKNYRYNSNDETDIEFARTEWESVD